MNQAIAALVLVLVAANAWAHKDKRLSLSSDGSIPELPAQYSEARADIRFTDAATGQLTRLAFTTKNRQTVIAPCLLKLVRATSIEQVSLAGSWYHDERLLPAYVHILFQDPSMSGSDPETPGIQFLFSLRDARLLEVKQIVPLPAERAVQYRTVPLHNGCPRQQ